jgi:hypothetical protein
MRTLQSHEVCLPVCTYGEVFTDGAIIELVQKAGILNLFIFDGKLGTIVPEAQFRGRLLRPPTLSRSIEQVVKFPAECVDFGSTTRFFTAIQKLVTDLGFTEEAGLAATHFTFSTWFPEVLPIAPCLLITGSRLEASLLLQLLRCLVRRPLLLGEVTRHGLRSLPMELRPTLLINAERIGSATLELFRTANHRNAFFPSKNGLMDFFCSKAVYCGNTADSAILGESALHISLPPSRGRLPIFDEQFGDEVAQEFQSKFLAYRCFHFLKARDSRFDLPEATPATRLLARVLGAAIIDAPALRGGLVRLLRDHDLEQQALRWTDLPCIVIEALLHHCHKEPGGRVHVGTIAKTVERILKGRDEESEREPRAIGTVLTDLKVPRKRDGDGYAILLNSAVCRYIHRLAYGYDVSAMQKGEMRCAFCQSIPKRPSEFTKEETQK